MSRGLLLVRAAGFTVYMPSLFGATVPFQARKRARRSFSAPASAPSFALWPQTNPAP
jgi:hypothetical protein